MRAILLSCLSLVHQLSWEPTLRQFLRCVRSCRPPDAHSLSTRKHLKVRACECTALGAARPTYPRFCALRSLSEEPRRAGDEYAPVMQVVSDGPHVFHKKGAVCVNGVAREHARACVGDPALDVREHIVLHPLVTVWRRQAFSSQSRLKIL